MLCMYVTVCVKYANKFKKKKLMNQNYLMKKKTDDE